MVERRAEAERAAAANARERQSLAEQLQLEVWAGCGLRGCAWGLRGQRSGRGDRGKQARE